MLGSLCYFSGTEDTESALDPTLSVLGISSWPFQKHPAVRDPLGGSGTSARLASLVEAACCLLAHTEAGSRLTLGVEDHVWERLVVAVLDCLLDCGPVEFLPGRLCCLNLQTWACEEPGSEKRDSRIEVQREHGTYWHSKVTQVLCKSCSILMQYGDGDGGNNVVVGEDGENEGWGEVVDEGEDADADADDLEEDA